MIPSYQTKIKMATRIPNQLFVSRLSYYLNNEEFKKLFAPFGQVIEARLVMDPITKRHKGFGFITYDSEAEAEKALKAMNYRIVQGRLIFVEAAKTGIGAQASS